MYRVCNNLTTQHRGFYSLTGCYNSKNVMNNSLLSLQPPELRFDAGKEPVAKNVLMQV